MKVSETIKALFKGEKEETNKCGNTIQRAHYPAVRYLIDHAEYFSTEGWKQFDTNQDAHYFGYWVNPKTLQTLCYIEGDWILCTCKDIEHYNSEINDAINFYSDGYEFEVLGKDGLITLRQDRKVFLIEV